MRIAILSDVHSNLAALQAVLRHAQADGEIDAVWCLGDIVGYGAEPSETIAALRAWPLSAVAGNHDLAATGAIGVDEFNPVAAEAALWTGRQLSKDEASFLLELPETVIHADFTLVHGSLRGPVWEYLLDAESAEAHFALQTTPCGLVGHTHLPFLCGRRADGHPEFHRAGDGMTVDLDGGPIIINPGSTGQPRDGDPRSSYVLYDADAASVTWHRVEYDIAVTQRKIRDAGLPEFLAARLAMGK
jgi:predicted phosphodiesterase